MKRILHFQNITFKSSYNWFKIDIHQQLRPLTANNLAMFKVTSTTIYTSYKSQTECKTRFHSQGMILNGFSQYVNGMRDQTPFMEKSILKFHFDYWNPSLTTKDQTAMLSSPLQTTYLN